MTCCFDCCRKQSHTRHYWPPTWNKTLLIGTSSLPLLKIKWMICSRNESWCISDRRRIAESRTAEIRLLSERPNQGSNYRFWWESLELDWRTKKIYSGLGDGGGAGLDNGDEMADSANFTGSTTMVITYFQESHRRSLSTRNLKPSLSTRLDWPPAASPRLLSTPTPLFLMRTRHAEIYFRSFERLLFRSN